MDGCQMCSKVNDWTCWRPLVVRGFWIWILSNFLARVLNSTQRQVKGSLVKTFLDTSLFSEERLIMSNSSISAQVIWTLDSVSC